MKYLLPLVLFIVLALLLGVGLTLKPHDIPSPFIGKPAPTFSATNLLNSTEKLSPADLKGKVWMFNVWASWCVSCREEHPILTEFAKQKAVLIVGLDYKDEADDAKKWLEVLGNPYDVVLSDNDGRIGIDWGVYGVPETFIVDKKGIIRYKHTAPITPNDIQTVFLPLINQLQAENP
ncbi:Thiol:disulfide interchange protein CycY [Patescibacteria group bacterium]|nr:Thiol:disulfide interchange protein CycY [Patescibacteria group bacterium]